MNVVGSDQIILLTTIPIQSFWISHRDQTWVKPDKLAIYLWTANSYIVYICWLISAQALKYPTYCIHRNIIITRFLHKRFPSLQPLKPFIDRHDDFARPIITSHSLISCLVIALQDIKLAGRVRKWFIDELDGNDCVIVERPGKFSCEDVKGRKSTWDVRIVGEPFSYASDTTGVCISALSCVNYAYELSKPFCPPIWIEQHIKWALHYKHSDFRTEVLTWTAMDIHHHLLIVSSSSSPCIKGPNTNFQV